MSLNQSIRSQAEMKKAHVGDLAGSVGRDTTLGGIMAQDEEYQRFVRDKLGIVTRRGIETPLRDYGLFPHQTDLVKWALRRATAAIFADTGLGKSRMQVAWADMVHRHTGGDVLILAPLAVAEQTVGEGQSIGVSVTHAREEDQLRPGINITNYDRIHKFNCSKFAGVVLDESSIIKHHTAKTLQTLLDAFRHTQFKLCATATPAPNDWTELGNHSEFLGVRSRSEMLAEFFVHDAADTGTWRLKGHARNIFWQWVASWGAMIRSPADLGHDASLYALPPLHVQQHTVEIEHNPAHGLFPMEAQSLMERRDARKQSMSERVMACSEIVNSNDEPWVVWCDLNAEGDFLEKSIRGAVQISGSDDADVKEKRLHDFAHGHIRVLVSKVSICGFGLNWQHCRNMAFVGVTDSFEAYYQAVRRCWRFGQRHPVNVHVFASNLEGAVVANLRRKEMDAKEMADAMAIETIDAIRSEVLGRTKETNIYRPDSVIRVPKFLEVV
ncbi:MAG: helicase [Betaproteobacteria bacterium]|nr:helicase [Betaproteobacteria bacterium]